jgi:uncharacterized protein YqeY
MSEPRKQAVTGFRILGYQVKKAKEGEVVKLVLEASVDQIGAAHADIGEIMKAFQYHMAGETDVGLSVLVTDEVPIRIEEEPEEEE